MKKLTSILAGVLMVGLFAGTLYFLWHKSHKPRMAYTTESPKVTTIIDKAVATGSIIPRQEVEIKSRVSGIVEAIAVEPGQMVKEGDLIARIRLVPDMVTLNDAHNRVARAEIAFENAKKDYDRNQALLGDSLMAAAAFETYEIAYSNAQVELQSAKDDLALIEKGISPDNRNASNTLVRSTITGMVLEVPVEVGHSVIEANTFNDGTTLASVANMDDMIFDGKVDESEVGKLKPGMKLLLTVGALETVSIEAVLERIAPKGVEQDGAIQFEIRAAVKPQPGIIIRDNYSANADIVLDRRDSVLAINESLLKFDQEKKYVEIEVAPDRFERRDIQTGLSDGMQIEVVSGLKLGDKIKAQPVAKPGNG